MNKIIREPKGISKCSGKLNYPGTAATGNIHKLYVDQISWFRRDNQVYCSDCGYYVDVIYLKTEWRGMIQFSFGRKLIDKPNTY